MKDKPTRNERFRSGSQMISMRLTFDVLGAIDKAADEFSVSRSEAIATALKEWCQAYDYLPLTQQKLLMKVKGQ